MFCSRKPLKENLKVAPLPAADWLSLGGSGTTRFRGQILVLKAEASPCLDVHPDPGLWKVLALVRFWLFPEMFSVRLEEKTQIIFC